MSDAPPVSPPGTWTKRRRLVHYTLGYCAVIVPVLTFRFPESALVSQTNIALIALASSVLAFYIGGATWDDANARKATK